MTATVVSLPRTAPLIRCSDNISHADVSAFAAEVREKAPWHLPIIHALLAGEIALCQVRPGQHLPMAKIKACGIPAIIHLLDDGPEWLGPDAFPAASYALDWARGIMVNGTGGEAHYYASAVRKAQELGRVAIVDTGTEFFDSWCRGVAANAPKAQVLAIATAPGDFHPAERVP